MASVVFIDPDADISRRFYGWSGPAELDYRIRNFSKQGKGKRAGCGLFFSVSGIVCYRQFFPVLTDWFTKHYDTPAGVYLMFAAVCSLGLWFSWKFVPETKGLSLEKISEFWEQQSGAKLVK